MPNYSAETIKKKEITGTLQICILVQRFELRTRLRQAIQEQMATGLGGY